MTRYMLLGEFLSTVNVLYGWSDVLTELKRVYGKDCIVYSIIDISDGSRHLMSREDIVEFARKTPVLGVNFTDTGVQFVPKSIKQVFEYMLARLKLAGVALEYSVGTAVDPDLVVLLGMSYNGSQPIKLVLPYGVSVLRLRNDRNKERAGIRELILPDSCTIIEGKSIYGFKDLKHIRFPRYVNTFGGSAVAACPNIESMDMPEEIQNVECLFMSLSDTKLSDKCEHLFDNTYFSGKIAVGAFQTAYGIHDIKLRVSRKAIQEGVSVMQLITNFASDGIKILDLSDLTNIDVLTDIHFTPDPYVKSMSPTRMERVILPSTIRILSQGVFEEVYNLKYCEFPDSIQHIQNSAFYGLSEFMSTEIGKLTLPSTLKLLGDRAFRGTAIREVRFNSVDSRLAKEQANIRALDISKDLTEYNACVLADECLSECGKLKYVDLSNLGTVKLGRGVFQGNISMTDLILPKNILPLNSSNEFSLFEGEYPIVDNGSHDASLYGKTLEKFKSTPLHVTIRSGGTTEKYAKEGKLFPDIARIGKPVEYVFI